MAASGKQRHAYFVGSYHLPNFDGFVRMAGPELSSPADLRGRRLGVADVGGSSDLAAQYMLDKFGLRRGEDVFVVSLGLMFLVGLGAISMAATANTTIQLAVPDHLRGRTMSVYTTVFAGSTPVGALLMGWFASRFGVAEAMLLGGVICALIGAVAFAWTKRIRAASVIAARSGNRSVGPGAQPRAVRPR